MSSSRCGHWVENGVSYWAVSDVSVGDLGQLVKFFRAPPP
jgi:hypothetical protein